MKQGIRSRCAIFFVRLTEATVEEYNATFSNQEERLGKSYLLVLTNYHAPYQ
jgi:hypothetical protein